MSGAKSACRQVWSEHVPYSELQRPEVLDLLAERSLGLLVAVQPENRRHLPPLFEACASSGVELGLWPLLEDSEGRWPSDANTGAFRGHLLRLLDVVLACRASPTEVVFDLEPPISEARRALALRMWDGRVNLRPANVDRAEEHFGGLVAEVASSDIPATAVVPPMILWDPLGRAGGWQRLLGTPVDGPPFSKISVMAYTSLLEGYSRKALTRRDSRALLAALCRESRRRWGERAAIALGVVGGGALGDERPYRGPAELADDVSIARAAGFDELSLFGLTGALERKPTSRWLDAFTVTDAAPNLPRPTARSRATWIAGWSTGRLLELSYRVLRPPQR